MKYKPIIILISNQELVADNFIEKLKSQITDDPAKLLYSSYHFDSKSTDELLINAKTPSMFHDKKLVYIKHIDSKGIKNCIKELPLSANDFLQVVFKTDKNSKEFAKFEENATVVNLDSKTRINEQVLKEAEKLDMKLTRGAVNALITLTGDNLNLLRNELEKLSLSELSDVISEKEIFEFTQKQNHDNIYSFISAFVSRDIGSASKALKELEEKREDPIGIISLLTWRIRQIFKTVELVNQGKSNEEIAKTIKTSKGAVYYILKDCKKFSLGEMSKIIKVLSKTDKMLKSSNENEFIILSDLVFKICKKQL